MARLWTDGWMLTLGLTVLALVAAVFAPQLAPWTPPSEPDVSADVCVRLGPYECCYREDMP